MNKTDFITKAITIWGLKYDYSLVEYKNNLTKVKIICKIHGIFEQQPNNHLVGKIGCKQCAKLQKTISKEVFLQRANNKHKFKFQYDLTNYINQDTKIDIICSNGHKFQQTPNAHIYGKIGKGCKQCLLDAFNTTSFIKRAKEKHGEKYDYSLTVYKAMKTIIKIICPKHGVFEQRPDNHLHNGGCNACGQETHKLGAIKFIKQSKELHGEKYDYSLVDYNNYYDKVKIICPKHGVIEQSPNNHLQGSGCFKCACNGTSSHEETIENFLKRYHINYKHRFKIGKHEIDFYIPEFNIGIEIDGLYWHSELLGKDKTFHIIKTNLCTINNIQLIHIFENEFISKTKIIMNRLKNVLKLIKQSVYARNCEIKVMDGHIKNKFLNKYHLQGEDKSCINLGLFYKNRLVSVMTFSKLRKALGQTHKINHYELSRFCSINNFNIVGGASKLLSYFKKTYNPEQIITYADRRWSCGNLYYKLGFKLDHISKPNYWYFKNNKHIYHRFNFRKSILKNKLENFNSNETEWENMQHNGWNRIWDCGNLVFKT